MKKIYKLLIIIGLVAFITPMSAGAIGGSGISSRALWKSISTNNIAPLSSNWSLGASTSRIAGGFFTNLNVTNFTTSGVSSSVRTVTTTGSILITDSFILCDTTSSQITLTLPTVAAAFNPIDDASLQVNVKNIGIAGNSCIVDGDTAETIDNSADDSLADLQAGEYISDDTEWWKF